MSIIYSIVILYFHLFIFTLKQNKNSLTYSQIEKLMKVTVKHYYDCYAPEKIPETPVFLESGCDSPEEVA